MLFDTLPAREGFHVLGAGGRGGDGDAARHGDDGVLGRLDDGIIGWDGDAAIHHGVD